MNDYLTLSDLAERWGVKYGAVLMQRSRGRLPEPDVVVSRVPMWSLDTIESYERESNGSDTD